MPRLPRYVLPGQALHVIQRGNHYLRYLNSREERTGMLWEGRYRATLIESARYLWTYMRYNEPDPERRHGISPVRPSLLESNRQGTRSGEPAAQAPLNEIREATNKAWALA